MRWLHNSISCLLLRDSVPCYTLIERYYRKVHHHIQRAMLHCSQFSLKLLSLKLFLFSKLVTYVLVWEPVSKQKRLFVHSQKQCFKFRYLFFYKDTFIYHINLEELKKQNFVAFILCVF